MTFLVPELFRGPPGHRQSPEGHPLIKPDPISNISGFADHHAGSMIDEETFTNSGAGMDIDARFAVGIFGHNTRHKGDPQLKKLVGQAIDGDGKKTGIAENNFISALGCRIPFQGGPDIFSQH